MEIRVNYFKLGFFVLSGLILLIVGLIFLGAGILGQDEIFIETYFNESVQGLSSGSAVNYRGFPIGKVKDISFVTQEYDIPPESPLYDKYLKYVMVVVSIEAQELTKEDELLKKMFDRSIKEGARIRLKQQPLTGVSYLDIDFLDPEDYPPMELQWDPKNLYMPSAPSLLSTFTQSAEAAFKQLAKVDLGEMTKNMNEMLVSITETLEQAEIGEISEELKVFLNEMRQTNRDFRSLLQSDDPNIPATLPEVINRFDATLRDMQMLLKTKSGDFSQIIRNFKEISSNLSLLVQDIREQPSKLIYSNPPQESEVLK